MALRIHEIRIRLVCRVVIGVELLVIRVAEIFL
jgi:hypothetical protein